MDTFTVVNCSYTGYKLTIMYTLVVDEDLNYQECRKSCDDDEKRCREGG